MGAPPFIDFVAVRPISLIGTRTPACVPCTYILREAGNGVVVKADAADLCPLPVADPLPGVWSLMRSSFLLNAVFSNKKAAPIKNKGVRQRDQRYPVVLASLRWYYPGQVLRVVRSGGLSAVWPP